MKVYKFKKGMTLIEITIVISILSVIMVGVFQAYSTALKIVRTSNPKNGTTRRDMLFALENVRATFAQTFYLQGHKRLIFAGKSDGVAGARYDKVTLAAYHANSEETGSPGVREVSFFTRPMPPTGVEDEGFYYLIRREDEMVDADPENGGVEHVLLTHVKSFQLKYTQRGDKWVDEWNTNDTKKIPKLIRIELIALVGDMEVRYEALANPGMYFK